MSGFLEPEWLAPLFIAACLAGVALMARVAGWPNLAKTFRAQGVPVGDSLRFVTGSLGSQDFPVRYKNCLRLSLNRDGIYVALMFPFKFASPALFVPWSQVASCTMEQWVSTQTVAFRFHNQWPGLKLRGLAGQLSHAAYQEHLASEAAAGTPASPPAPGTP